MENATAEKTYRSDEVVLPNVPTLGHNMRVAHAGPEGTAHYPVVWVGINKELADTVVKDEGWNGNDAVDFLEEIKNCLTDLGHGAKEKFTVRGSYQFTVYVTVEGVEADDESDAEGIVEDNVSCSLDSYNVEADMYGGEFNAVNVDDVEDTSGWEHHDTAVE